MFHHFHGKGHPEAQGSISDATFEQILYLVGLENILPAQEWLERAKKQTLKKNHVCLTFDDALLCQYDVAKPILDKHGLTAFWFVYSSILRGELEKLELFRHFRTTQFESIDHFYELFFLVTERQYGHKYKEAKKTFNPDTYLVNSPFYTDNDRWFRYLRDQFLGSQAYEALMDRFIADRGYNLQKAARQLWLTRDQVIALANNGHCVGLHSDSHPTTMGKLSAEQQLLEYRSNSEYLNKMLGERPQSMSHPCNSYSTETLAILKGLGVHVGFRADVASIANRSMLEFPREDHANLVSHLGS
ncbi:polysaccharide deacetylase family protein [Roseibium sp. SCPC15]|uniref:polysaccharide deacetylase family protein n=1 Tax=Roseibium sp. SCP15 TaxID=3141376 RepID=UPI003337F74C